ncbi:hypothetical protein KUL17_12980 [Alteromonas sp. KUL17]|nr:hypothetical protein KUL17_12980 [Alteromonas sp. KUL17]
MAVEDKPTARIRHVVMDTYSALIAGNNVPLSKQIAKPIKATIEQTTTALETKVLPFITDKNLLCFDKTYTRPPKVNSNVRKGVI